jgi:hypothetical protein
VWNVFWDTSLLIIDPETVTDQGFHGCLVPHAFDALVDREGWVFVDVSVHVLVVGDVVVEGVLAQSSCLLCVLIYQADVHIELLGDTLRADVDVFISFVLFKAPCLNATNIHHVFVWELLEDLFLADVFHHNRIRRR